jgi:hypothetical protein
MLASRLTRLSLALISMASSQEFTNLVEEWCHIRALTLTLSSNNCCVACITPLAASLEYLELHGGSKQEVIKILDCLISSPVWFTPLPLTLPSRLAISQMFLGSADAV